MIYFLLVRQELLHKFNFWGFNDQQIKLLQLVNSFALSNVVILFSSRPKDAWSAHFRGLLIEISWEFVSPRTVKNTQPIIRVKKRKFLPFTIGFWVQLRSLTAATREWLPESLLEPGAERLLSTSCMRSRISSVNTCTSHQSPLHLYPTSNSPLFDDVILSH